jgi:thiamine biosynthesis lipoprotein
VADSAVQDAARLQAEVDVLLERVNDQMSTYRPDSELSRFNQHKSNAPVVVSRDTARVVTEAIHIGRESRGALDVTVGPLVNLWGFGPDARPSKVPSDELIAQTRQKTGLGNLHVITSADADTLQKDIPDLYVDLSAIAKGFGVDKVAEYLESQGARNYLVEIGGECRCQGVSSKGIPWRIGIETPFDGNMSDGAYLTGRIRMSEGGLATSGNYRRFYRDAAGNKISHTIDPTTGRSVTSRLLSATVVADNCAEADAMATMYLSLGANKAIALSRKIPDAKVYFILDDGKDGYEIYCSPAMQEMMIPE